MQNQATISNNERAATRTRSLAQFFQRSPRKTMLTFWLKPLQPRLRIAKLIQLHAEAIHQ